MTIELAYLWEQKNVGKFCEADTFTITNTNQISTYPNTFKHQLNIHTLLHSMNMENILAFG